MTKIKLLISILVILLYASPLVWASSIGIKVGAGIVEIVTHYKTFQLAIVFADKYINQRSLEAIRSGAINHFPFDPIPWVPGFGRQIVESELALQWGVVEYLERIYRQKDLTKLKKINSLKESLLASTEVLEKTKLPGTRHIVDKTFYDNIVSVNRKYLEKLLQPL